MQEKDIEAFENEINIQLRIGKHENIVRVHHYFEDHHRYMMIMELVEGGELYDHLQQVECYDSPKACQIIK